ncbi:MAG: hypothetical protein CBB87_08080 [Micavibrio sp. TMED27]|nr:hypothetical protein [Micavibrio sp.]OUT90628.1 MAG: hypothetical protein CBB87_08080 [Micavibrio sp. TMED27]|tara:strand:- start:3291 stop:3695 length:405 start_codon:yes stop_codon:yes gene_type:complete
MLTKPRNTPSKGTQYNHVPLAANVEVHQGALVALDAAGNLVPGSAVNTLKKPGRATEAADNTGGAAGDLKCRVDYECSRYDNSAAADEITRADIGSDCYIVDDETVAKTDGGGARSVAGEIFDVDAGGVWVKFK